MLIGNLSKMNRLLRILDIHACSLGLTPSQTAYHKWGRGGKGLVLRFSKSGEPGLEAAYSRHYVRKAAAQIEMSRQANCTEKAKQDAVCMEEPRRLLANAEDDD